MNWLQVIGWFFVIVPVIGLLGFSVWMIISVMNDDDGIKAFVIILVAAWFVGLAILLLTYFTNFMALAGLI